MTRKAGLRIGLCLAAMACLALGVWAVTQFATPDRDPNTPTGAGGSPGGPSAGGFTGSVGCRECHEPFYKLWASSHHGLAMQPFTAELAQTKLTAQTESITIGRHSYRAEFGETAWVHEDGPDGKKKYRIEHAMGGKNIYYFLTPMARGRLQVLPVSYDVNEKAWIDTTGSMLRHAGEIPDEAIPWTDPMLTFNTACFNCHVSQLSRNYDLKSDTYRTAWAEPGINCETCHGPGGEHVRVCKAAPEGRPPKDLKIIVLKTFTPEQNNSLCAPCHAKMRPLTTAFPPGERFFDHFDLVCLEHSDFYPDGRDLGENYTYTLWRMSPCAKSGKLDCTHCHTSSGRYRFEGDKANDACLPCHAERVANAPAHTRHKADGEGNRCIGCHMPMTGFARMRRSDHSMLPPTPAATIEYKSPNACNICHDDKDAAWSEKFVREWRERDYQAPVLYRAGLIDAARRRRWAKLPEMLAYLAREDREEIFAASLLRLLGSCLDERKWPAIVGSLKDPSPLVRACAAGALADRMDPDSVAALVAATRDEYHLVRIQAAASLTRFPPHLLGREEDRKGLEKATAEFVASLTARPDDYASYYNLGNFHTDKGEFRRAIELFAISARLRTDAVPPLVNASIAHARLGENAPAETLLHKALKIDPNSAAASFNMGLLMAEKRDMPGADRYLRRALQVDPNMAEAAYNLGVLVSSTRPAEGIEFCRKAASLRPDDPKYAYTLAFFLNQGGQTEEATRVLHAIIERKPPRADVYLLLIDIYSRQRKLDQIREVCRQGLANEGLPPDIRNRFQMTLQTLAPR